MGGHFSVLVNRVFLAYRVENDVQRPRDDPGLRRGALDRKSLPRRRGAVREEQLILTLELT